MKRQFKAALCGGVALTAMALASPAIAQQTSSSIRGTVVSQEGTALADVTVVITHMPTGSRRTVSTNSDGVFFIRGLKVGGPYTVELADGSSYHAKDIEGLNLLLAQTAAVQLVAASTDVTLEEISVTAVRSTGGLRMGSSSDWSRDDIDNVSSVSRDIKSVMRQDPKVWIDSTNSDALTIAGTNSRFNSLTVDGVKQNDDFGLNNNGYPTQRSPISLDAIEQLSVQTSPSNVEFGGFQGGLINVVTKSGTNEFHGSAFYEFSNESLLGDRSQDNVNLGGDFSEKTFGATLGGPIVKDKLFFFASYEKYERTRPFEFALDSGQSGDTANVIFGVTQADVDSIVAIARDRYGYDPIGFGDVDLDEQDEKILLKLDWNINDFHRFSATYQRTDGNIINPQNTFSGGRFGDDADRQGSGGAGTLGGWYDKSDRLETYSFQLFSDWSDSLSTEIKVGLKDVTTGQVPLGGDDFALMEIETAGGGSVFIGPDFFRHANALSNETKNFKVKADYSTGDHLFTLGYELEKLDVVNLFVPGSNGDYGFDSIADFAAGNASTLFYQNAFTNVKQDGEARFGFDFHTFYLQDNWTVNDNLTVTAGVRAELVRNSDKPRENGSFQTRNGFSNTENLDGKFIFLPRFGFNYLAGERTTISGSAGLYSGGSPNVWVSNSYSNDGQIIDNVFLGNWFADLSNIDGFNVPQAAQDALTPGDGNVNAIHPDMDLPSVWKYSVAVEHEFDLSFMGLGDGWNTSAEVIFTDVKDAIIWQETRRSQVGNAPDGRPIYDVPGGYDLLLNTTNAGSGQVVTLNFDKDWDTDAGVFSVRAGYSWQDVEDVNPGTSSTATSNFGKAPTSDRNGVVLGTSDSEIKHRITASLNWRKDFWDDNTTNLNIFFSTRSGKHFSYTFDDAGSRTGPSSTLEEVLADPNTVFGGDRDFWRRDTQLFYVPTGVNDPLVTYNGVDAAALDQWITENGLDEYRGGIAPRGLGQSPWQTKVDLRLSQELPVPGLSGHKITLSLDIDNLTNLLDKDWGRVEQVGFPFNRNVVRAAINDAGQYEYSRFIEDFSNRFYELPSLWKVKFGISYKF